MAEDATHTNLIEALERETVNRYQLPNGLTVVHQEDRAADLVSVQTWVRTGSIHEGDLLGAGLSHYLEHLLFKGTNRRGPLDISREINACGGYINAYTTFDRTVYYIDGPADAAASIFDVLGDMTLNAALPEDEIIRERDVILREIDMGLDDPDRRLFRSLASTAFRQHPYGHPVIGHRALFEQVSPADLRAYYQGRYAPNNITLVVAGAISNSDCRALAEQHFGQAPMRQLAPAWVPPEPSQLAPRESREQGDFEIVRGFISYKVPGVAHEDAPALDILASLLGSGDSSTLWQSLRVQQRLAHEISAGCWNPGDGGLFWIGYGCGPGKREALENAVRQELTQAAETPPPASDVAKAVRRAFIGEVNGRRTISARASRLGQSEVVEGDLGYCLQRLRQLSKLKPEDIQRAAQRYLKSTGETCASLEPEPEEKAAPSIMASTALPDFEEVTFANGARLLLQPGGAFPKTHVRYVSLGGPLYDPRDRQGATGVLASLLVRDTESRSQAEVAATIESIGGYFREDVGNNTFSLCLETLPGDFGVAAELLGDSLHRAAMLESTMQVERDAQLASLREEHDEVLDWSRSQMRQAYFGEHPFAVDYLGTENGLNAMTVGDVRSLAKRLLAGPNAVLAITGQFERNAAVDLLGPILESLPAEFAPADCPKLTPALTGKRVLTRDREQAIVLVAYADTGVRQTENFLITEALDEVFSGMSSQLFQRVREEKGMAYFVASQRISGLDCGLFTFYAGTSPEQAAAVEAEIHAEVERARNGGITADELSACQTRLIVRRQEAMQSPGGRAARAALMALYGQPVNAWRDYPELVRTLTLDQLTAYAQQCFVEERRLIQQTLPG